MGDKIAAKRHEKSRSALRWIRTARCQTTTKPSKAGEGHWLPGYSLAAGGGGGRSMRVVHTGARLINTPA